MVSVYATRQPVCFIGDGGFALLMAAFLNAVKTAVKYGLRHAITQAAGKFFAVDATGAARSITRYIGPPPKTVSMNQPMKPTRLFML